MVSFERKGSDDWALLENKSAPHQDRAFCWQLVRYAATADAKDATQKGDFVQVIILRTNFGFVARDKQKWLSVIFSGDIANYQAMEIESACDLGNLWCRGR